MQVKKRDGSLQLFNIHKVHNAIAKALHNNDDAVNRITSDVQRIIQSKDVKIIDIEDVQDAVEYCLMSHGYFDVAKSYILYRQNRHATRNIKSVLEKFEDIDVPWGPIGYITYKRTYARPLDKPGRTEEYRDTVIRVLAACQTQLSVGFTNEEIKKVYQHMMNLRFTVAGRFMWQLGTTTVQRLGLASLQNCAFVKIDDPIESFKWIFDMLMLGVGVGFNIQKHNISKLPPVKNVDVYATRLDTKDADFIVPDSREGWVALLGKVLKAHFVTGKSFTYSTILIRGAGTPIKGFGGIASGPEEFCKGIDQIQALLQSKHGQQLSSVDCLDIVNIIASIVVAGNIRRSALLCLGDYDDIEYLQAKRWDLGNIPNWRAFSNNSVVCDDITKLPDLFWEGYKGNGEPYGLINIELARKVGRVKDGNKYPDPDVDGVNPCAEIFLSNLQTCCLSELFLPNINTLEEAKEVATFAYRICKHSLLLPCHQQGTQEAVHKDLRIGIGITGYMQATEEQKTWLDPLYDHLRKFDAQYSFKHDIPQSVKLTTTKPSGTLSLLAGVTPGAHPGIYPYFIRRIRIASTNPLVELCKSHNYHCEFQKNFDGSEDKSTYVVSFPCSYPEHTVFAKDMSAIDQLEVVKRLQHEWSDNAVSVTIYYRLHELDDVKLWLKDNYTNHIKSCSFLLHSDHGFTQAPYEEITKEVYDQLVSTVIPIKQGHIDIEDDYGLECVKGVCPIK